MAGEVFTDNDVLLHPVAGLDTWQVIWAFLCRSGRSFGLVPVRMPKGGAGEHSWVWQNSRRNNCTTSSTSSTKAAIRIISIRIRIKRFWLYDCGPIDLIHIILLARAEILHPILRLPIDWTNQNLYVLLFARSWRHEMLAAPYRFGSEPPGVSPMASPISNSRETTRHLHHLGHEVVAGQHEQRGGPLWRCRQPVAPGST